MAVGQPVLATSSGSYIVILRTDGAGVRGVASAPSVQSVLQSSRATSSIRPTAIYRAAVQGFAATLTSAQARALAADARVAEVVPDVRVQLADAWRPDDDALPLTPPADPEATPVPSPSITPKPTLPTPGPDYQIVPTGIERVGRTSLDEARLDGGDEQLDIDIAIVDTGVDEHPDLNVVGGVDCTGSRIGWHDGHGHGTHVAGTAAARDNDFGVVGIAPGARIWSVKVLNKRGWGTASALLCGVDWIASQRDGDKPLIEIVNMSLQFHGVRRKADDGDCGRTNNDPIHQAICASAADGTIYVVAAGNSRKNAARFRPAAYDEVITVSALSDYDGKPGGTGVHSAVCPKGFSGDRDDVLASFSNFGPDVDVMAPGKCIWSTYKKGGYHAMSGTSMATPHVTGAVALYLHEHPSWTFDDVRTAIVTCGTSDWRWQSDRDRVHEPLLNIARLC
jgi:subtilisin family serine protease